ITPDLADSDYCEVYITRKQFMSEYEADKDACLQIMQQIAEMYTSPHCFESSPTEAGIEDIYNYLEEHKKSKVIVLQIIEVDPYKRVLTMYIVK
ncbi:hypothetical protein BGU80_19330, partial [Clostridioides difficile]|uniref:hypothetical protein n=1 Tax=Clostridioides difficile TaxID=1496 RepID=UPI000BD60AB7